MRTEGLSKNKRHGGSLFLARLSRLVCCASKQWKVDAFWVFYKETVIGVFE